MDGDAIHSIHPGYYTHQPLIYPMGRGLLGSVALGLLIAGTYYLSRSDTNGSSPNRHGALAGHSAYLSPLPQARLLPNTRTPVHASSQALYPMSCSQGYRTKRNGDRLMGTALKAAGPESVGTGPVAAADVLALLRDGQDHYNGTRFAFKIDNADVTEAVADPCGLVAALRDRSLEPLLDPRAPVHIPAFGRCQLAPSKGLVQLKDMCLSQYFVGLFHSVAAFPGPTGLVPQCEPATDCVSQSMRPPLSSVPFPTACGTRRLSTLSAMARWCVHGRHMVHTRFVHWVCAKEPLRAVFLGQSPHTPRGQVLRASGGRLWSWFWSKTLHRAQTEQAR